MKLTSLESVPQTVTSHAKAGKKHVLIEQGVIKGLQQFSQTTFDPGETVEKHMHEDMYEIFLVETGNAIFHINDALQPVKQGDCLVVEPGEYHEVTDIGSQGLTLTYFCLENIR